MSIIAVVVAHNPDLTRLSVLLDRLAPQVAEIVLVDNGQTGLERLRHSRRVTVLTPPQNLGLAAGHNLGISHAQNKGADHVVLFDQDSIPSATLIKVLLEAEKLAMQRGIKVAAVGPRYRDSRGMRTDPIRLASSLRSAAPRTGDKHALGDGSLEETDYLITSGALLMLAVVREIGMLDESLFIDYVDIEWCFRARARGYKCLVAREAEMEHQLGDTPVMLFGKPLLSLRSPFRYYYLYRNLLLLQRRDYIPLAWRIEEMVKAMIRVLILVAVSKDRKDRLKSILDGIHHGIQGVCGSRPPATS